MRSPKFYAKLVGVGLGLGLVINLMVFVPVLLAWSSAAEEAAPSFVQQQIDRSTPSVNIVVIESMNWLIIDTQYSSLYPDSEFWVVDYGYQSVSYSKWTDGKSRVWDWQTKSPNYPIIFSNIYSEENKK